MFFLKHKTPLTDSTSFLKLLPILFRSSHAKDALLSVHLCPSPPTLPHSPSVLILPFSLSFPASSRSLVLVPFLPRPFNVALPQNSSLTFSPCNLFLLNHLLSAHSFLDQTTSHVERKCRTKGPTYMIHYLLTSPDSIISKNGLLSFHQSQSQCVLPPVFAISFHASTSRVSPFLKSESNPSSTWQLAN